MTQTPTGKQIVDEAIALNLEDKKRIAVDRTREFIRAIENCTANITAYETQRAKLRAELAGLEYTPPTADDILGS